MTADSERVTIRIPKDRLDALEKMVQEGHFGNISDAIRAAIDSFIDTQYTPEHIKKLTLELPKLHHVSLEEMVLSGDAISVDEAVRNAVREYVKMRLKKATESQENK